jgi:hypothetical protein
MGSDRAVMLTTALAGFAATSRKRFQSWAHEVVGDRAWSAISSLRPIRTRDLLAAFADDFADI